MVVARASEEGLRRVQVPVLISPPLQTFRPSSDGGMDYTTLNFERRTVVVRDPTGREWTWYCWLDQYGRGISEKRRPR